MAKKGNGEAEDILLGEWRFEGFENKDTLAELFAVLADDVENFETTKKPFVRCPSLLSNVNDIEKLVKFVEENEVKDYPFKFEVDPNNEHDYLIIKDTFNIRSGCMDHCLDIGDFKEGETIYPLEKPPSPEVINRLTFVANKLFGINDRRPSSFIVTKVQTSDRPYLFR